MTRITPAVPGRLAGAGHAIAWAARSIARPVTILGFVEMPRAGMEAATTVASLPPLLTAPRGDGHPVLIVPGLSGGASLATALRLYLKALGYQVHTLGGSESRGKLGNITARLFKRIGDLADEHGPVSLIGWSVGGVLTRQAGLARAEQVRMVITLGTPSGGPWYGAVPDTADRPMPVPTTSVFSRSDPWFDWRDCIQPESPDCEDVAIVSSHFGMATNALAYHVIADRLALLPGHWSAYRSPRHHLVEAALR